MRSFGQHRSLSMLRNDYDDDDDADNDVVSIGRHNTLNTLSVLFFHSSVQYEFMFESSRLKFLNFCSSSSPVLSYGYRQ